MDLIRKTSISLTKETHARLMEFIGVLQAKQKVNIKADTALNVLLDGWDELNRRAGEVEVEDSEGRIDTAFVRSDFIQKNFNE